MARAAGEVGGRVTRWRICRASCAAPPRSRPRRRPGRCSSRCRATSSMPRPASNSAARPGSIPASSPSDESLQALAARILKAERPVIVVGDEIVKSDAPAGSRRAGGGAGLPALSVLDALRRAIPVRTARASSVPLARDPEGRPRARLAPYDLLIVLGGDPLRMSVYSETDPLPDGLSIVQIGAGRSRSRRELQRRYRAQGRRARKPCARWCRH